MIAKRTAELRERTAAKHRGHDSLRASRTVDSPSGSTADGREEDYAVVKLGSHRVLIDPQSLRLVYPLGNLEKQKAAPRPKRAGTRRLVEPKLRADGLRNRTSIRLYSGLDKENVGLELLRMLFSSDKVEISDIRAQRGVGADAIDELRRYYELKVSAGAEPDQVTLTNSEVKRALTTPDFFLVIVSGIEGVDARPKIRVIVDPLSQLQPTESGSITLSGVRSAMSLTYEFENIDGPMVAIGREELNLPID